MPTVNEHIVRYLDGYFRKAFNAGFAVMISGPWGCGKTWFIKQYVENYKSADPSPTQKIVYVSLFGVPNITEARKRVISAVYLTDKAAKYVEMFAGLATNVSSAVGFPVTVDLDSIAQLMEVKEDVHIILDDVERNKIDAVEILGFVDSLLEGKHGTKVILIANEAAIKDAEYKVIKEKTIGKTFYPDIDIGSALTNFLKDWNPEWPDIRTAAREVFANGGHENLRHLKMAIAELDQSFTMLKQLTNEDYLSNRELSEDFAKAFLAVFIELRVSQGKIDDQEFGRVLKEKYGISPLRAVFRAQVWRQIVASTHNEALIVEALTNSQYYAERSRRPWVKLAHWASLNQQQFDLNIDLVQKSIINSEYVEPHEILHVFGLLLKFAYEDVFETVSKVITLYREYLENVTLIIDPGEQELRHDAYGLAIQGTDKPEYASMEIEMYEAIHKRRESMMVQRVKDALAALPSSTIPFITLLSYNPNDGNGFLDLPILSSVELAELDNHFRGLTYDQRERIVQAIRKRIQQIDDLTLLQREREFVDQLTTFIIAAVKSMSNTIEKLPWQEQAREMQGVSDYIAKRLSANASSNS